MASRRNKTREKVAEMPGASLGFTLLHTSNFKNSTKYKLDPYNEDEDTPLDCVTFDEKTKRYKVSEASGFTEDDAILEALVMFFLFARLKFGWGLKDACSQLSVWCKKSGKRKREDDAENTLNGSGNRNPNQLDNLWSEEMKTFGLEKQLSHQDNFDAIRTVFVNDASGGGWDRRSFAGKKPSKRSRLHELTEQAAIQWALQKKEKDTDRYMIIGPSMLIKMYCQYPAPQSTPRGKKELFALGRFIQEVCYVEASRDDDDFCRRAVAGMEDLDWDAMMMIIDMDDQEVLAGEGS
ncbi:MAG: hypothetical protein SGILL_010321 [Bacillariaceae sp.]